MRLATWNVNSLRARMERVEPWLAAVEPDVVCMQETKLATGDFPHLALESLGYECAHHGETGLIVSDWSGYGLDTHVSQCVASFVLSRRLPLHPSVYYASSLTTQAIQVADLVAGIRRRVVEGDQRLGALSARLAAVRALPTNINATTHSGRPYTNEIDLF